MTPVESQRRVQRSRRWTQWLGGFIIGWLAGVVSLLVLAGLSVRLAPQSSGPVAGSSDIVIQINGQYLNDVVRRRLAQSPPQVFADITTTGLDVGLVPQAGMVLTPTFSVAGLFQISPTVDNQLTINNGKLAMNMIGDPRLGNLPVPIEVLPFNLAAEVRGAVDQITNELLLSELNGDLRAGFGSDTFTVMDVQTIGNYLAIKLHRH